MQRREFISVLGGAAAAWPLAARAQQPAMPVIGFLQSGSPGATAHMLAAFHSGLREAGFVEGQNIEIINRYADGQYDRLPMLATELVQRRVAVLAATGGDAAIVAAVFDRILLLSSVMNSSMCANALVIRGWNEAADP
jgi:putative tryptophan/tyrosine transport system substrate-binding protein